MKGDAEIPVVTLPPLSIVGVHTTSEGYPNTKYRLQGLGEFFSISENNVPLMLEKKGGIQYANSPLWSSIRLVYVHSATMLAATFWRPKERVYVPYPAPLILWMYSLLPRSLRPRRLVSDAFISIYDTVVNDRKLISPKGMLARLLRRLEKRGYATADCVVVDTSMNARFYAELFSLPESKFLPVPLSTNEVDYKAVPYEPRRATCEVLFIGTLVPLQGVETIVAAAALLSGYPEIHFTIIGDGQDSAKVAAAMGSASGNITWKREWMSSAELAAAIANADICLGIFGDGEKAQRVCPYKLYAYASIGRAVITGLTDWAIDAEIKFGMMPFSVVPVMNSDALAREVLRLSVNVDSRLHLSLESRRFYEAELSNSKSIEIVKNHLIPGNCRLDKHQCPS